MNPEEYGETLEELIKNTEEVLLLKVEQLIVEEIIICHKEGTPTSRLTSLLMRLKQI